MEVVLVKEVLYFLFSKEKLNANLVSLRENVWMLYVYSALFLIFFQITVFAISLYANGLISPWHNTLRFSIIVGLMALLNGYNSHSSGNFKVIKFSFLWLCTPFFICLVILIELLFIHFENVSIWGSWTRMFDFILITQILISLLVTGNHIRSIFNNDRRKPWEFSYPITFSFLATSTIALGLLQGTKDINLGIAFLLLTCFISIYLWNSILRSIGKYGRISLPKEDVKENLKMKKYINTGLSKEVSKAKREKLLKIMKDEKIYLNPDLRLMDIANLLNLSRHHASQIINENFGLSFYSFVNMFRLDEAERLIEESQKQDINISDIAYLSGFNTRASFYKAFKKKFNTTPTIIKKNHSQENTV